METERVHEGWSGPVDGDASIADRHADDLAALHRVSTLPPSAADERLGQWLDAGVAAVGAAQGVVLLGTGEELVVRAATEAPLGGVLPDDEVVDPRVTEAMARRLTVASLGGTRPTPGDLDLGRGSVVASPLWVSGEIRGAVALVAAPGHPPFSAWALALVDLVTDGVARVLEHQADERELVAVQSAAEAMIDLIPDPIVRLDRHGYLVDGPTDAPFDPCRAVRGPDEPVDLQAVERLGEGITQALADGELRTIVLATGSEPSSPRVEARVVPASDDEVLCIVRDITERHRAEQALADQVAFEALVTSISTRLISCAADQLDDAIATGLGEIAGFFGADTAFIDELAADGASLHLSHLWTRPGHAGSRRRGQRVDLGGFTWLASRFERSGHVFSRGPRHLAPDPEPYLGTDPDDLAVLWVRLGFGGDLAGVVGLTWTTKDPPAGDEVLGLVRFAADAFHGAIRRRSVALLAEGQAEVFESIARGEPVATSLLGVRDLLARHALGATVLVAAVDDGRLDLVTDEPDDPLVAWLAGLSLGLDNPYGQAAVTGEPVVVADARWDPRFGGLAVPDPGHRSVTVHPVRSSRDGRTLAVVAHLGDGSSAATPRPSVLAPALSLIAVALERAADTRRLAHQATHDPLTGVGNRAALLDRLHLVLARARRSGRGVAVLYCDLDGFKAVNDVHGHDRGDRLLVEVADRIRRAVRPSDTVSRTGGDEFVVVCEDLGTPDQADTIAQRVRDAVEGAPVVLGDARLDLAISVGVALADPLLDDPDRLLRTADLAMYESKQRSQRDRGAPVVLAPWSGARGRLRPPATGLEAELVVAIGDDALDLWHQPLVGRDGSLAGVEALLRWPGVDLGPERVVATAGELGLASALGRWVRRRALADRQGWDVPASLGRRPPVHVNVAGDELVGPSFLDDLVLDLREASAGPGDLVVEVREADLLGPEARSVLAELAGLAVPVVVDAVGQGGLALADLATLPVQAIKLGPDLVARLDVDGAGVEVARSLVLLAHGLAWHSLAVGVETDHQRSVLFGFGVDAVQGRAVAMPAEGADFQAWLVASGEG